MTAVETLREAARLMRERADAATDGPWVSDDRSVWQVSDDATVVVNAYVDENDLDMPHIASWHPLVAFAVADWLDAEVEGAFGSDFLLNERSCPALDVARAYLGETS